jgi:hypothetical protein
MVHDFRETAIARLSQQKAANREKASHRFSMRRTLWSPEALWQTES